MNLLHIKKDKDNPKTFYNVEGAEFSLCLAEAVYYSIAQDTKITLKYKKDLTYISPDAIYKTLITGNQKVRKMTKLLTQKG